VLTPLSLFGQLLIAVNAGLQRWTALIVGQATGILIPSVGTVVLFVADALTLRSAAILTLAGGVLSVAPVLPVLSVRKLRFVRLTVAAALSFGMRAWVGGLASLLNVRLDQLVMVTAVSSRELGLYVIAATLSSMSGTVADSVGGAVGPRIAQGELALAAVALRVGLWSTAIGNSFVAIAAPFAIPLLFGQDFAGALPMALVLLAAAVPLAGTHVLTRALVTADQPGWTSVGELVTLGVTVPGLLILLGPLGGLGAAIVSLVAYSSSFGILLARALRTFPAGLHEFLVPQRSDLRWAESTVRSRPTGRRVLDAIGAWRQRGGAAAP
jgi:O-antigen/teichoic acid export membrane protein